MPKNKLHRWPQFKDSKDKHGDVAHLCLYVESIFSHQPWKDNFSDPTTVEACRDNPVLIDVDGSEEVLSDHWKSNPKRQLFNREKQQNVWKSLSAAPKKTVLLLLVDKAGKDTNNVAEQSDNRSDGRPPNENPPDGNSLDENPSTSEDHPMSIRHVLADSDYGTA